MWTEHGLSLEVGKSAGNLSLLGSYCHDETPRTETTWRMS